MKTKFLFVLFLASFALNLVAQNVPKQVFSSGGESLTNSSQTLLFTIGEPIVGLVENNMTVNQGFLATASIDQMVSVAEQLTSMEIKLYPNPVHHNLNIILNDTSDPINLLLFDASGKQILSKKLNMVHNTLDTSLLPAGLYLVNLYNPNSIAMKSFKIMVR